jgi:hypothetical protein
VLQEAALLIFAFQGRFLLLLLLDLYLLLELNCLQLLLVLDVFLDDLRRRRLTVLFDVGRFSLEPSGRLCVVALALQEALLRKQLVPHVADPRENVRPLVEVVKVQVLELVLDVLQFVHELGALGLRLAVGLGAGANLARLFLRTRYLYGRSGLLADLERLI